jgi:hypothetical protein
MARVILTVLILATVLGAAYVYWNYQVETQYDNGRLVSVRITRRPDGTRPGLPWESANLPSARPLQPTFRMASFDVERLDERKLANRRISDVLLRVVPKFELIAIQGFQGPNRGEALRLVEAVNQSSGRQYDFAAPPVGSQSEYMAFIFDQTAIEVDRSTVHAVNDPAGVFRCPPLVAQFRVRGPTPNEAFTFQAISVRVDPERLDEQLALLDDVYRAVRDDGRNEDDIILLGALETDEHHLGQLGQVPELAPVVSMMPTTVRGTRRADNILLRRRATSEFTGRAEVFDLMRECDLTIEQALEVSEHLPVWAEFSSFEGGRPGVLAAQPGSPQ